MPSSGGFTTIGRFCHCKGIAQQRVSQSMTGGLRKGIRYYFKAETNAGSAIIWSHG